MLDMFPCFVSNNPQHLGGGEVVPFTQGAETCFSWFIKSTNFFYLRLCDLCHSMFFSKRNKSISKSIFIVPFNGGLVKVIWSYANFYITSMSDYFSFINRFIVESIGKTMSEIPGIVISRIKFSISTIGFCASPEPASFCFLNMFPESFLRFDTSIVTISFFRPDFHWGITSLFEVCNDVVAHDATIQHYESNVKGEIQWP